MPIDFDYAVLLEDGRLVYAGSPGGLEPLGCLLMGCGEERRILCTRKEIGEALARGCRVENIVC